MTGRFRSYLRRLTHALYDDYLGIVGRSVLHRLFTPREDPLWAALSHTFEYMLKWADLITGQALHKQADPRTPPLPVPDRLLDPGSSDFDWRGEWAKVYGETVERTSWAPEHVRETQPFIVERARLVAKAEADFLEERRKTQRLDPGWMPIYRIEMHRQMALKEIQQVSEQVELAVPEIGQQFPFVLYNTREDRRVRPTHAAMQGFIAARTWGGWPKVRPPNGYRCFLPGTNVSGSFVGGIKARYHGPATEIKTLNGHRLRVTANHPVMTPNGWVAAGNLKKGDALFGHRGKVEQIPASGSEHNKNSPSLIEDVFQAIASKRVAGSVLPVAPNISPLDFYGDARWFMGNVNVVGADRELMIDRPSEVADGLHERELTFGRAAQVFKARPSPRELGLNAVHPNLGRIPRLGQLPLDGGAILLDEGPLDPLRVGAAANWDAVAIKEPGDGGAAYAGFLRKLIDASSGLISLDQVASVRAFDFEGHVYDLESETGWILSECIVSSNCRCTLRYIAKHEARRLNWLDAQGDPLFEVRWPSSLAKTNYESGAFPDPGTPFVGPKVWAYGDDLAGVGD